LDLNILSAILAILPFLIMMKIELLVLSVIYRIMAIIKQKLVYLATHHASYAQVHCRMNVLNAL